MNRRYFRATIAAAAISATGFAAVTLLAPRPRLVWNASASVPVGLYRVTPPERLRAGDLVLVAPPERVARFLDRRRYLPLGTPLLKRVAALPGTNVCRKGAAIIVAGRWRAAALPRDRAGRPLPVWDGCRTLATGEILLLNDASASLDSRYFGPFRASAVIGIAHPVATRDAPGAPLRWRALARSTAIPPQNEEN